MSEIQEFVNKIICGDAVEVLKTLPENSVDSIIIDPPYGLEFMGKDWDKFKNGKNIAGGTTGLNTPYGRKRALPSFYQLKRFGKAGEEGKNDLKVKKNFKVLPRFFNSDLLNYQQFTFQWATECLRVLKSGGYLLSFGGTRTYHRMACGIEDAGFEIRDCIFWVYGSGFPKSLNIGKAIDKLQRNERKIIGEKQHAKKNFKDNLYAQDPANRNNKKVFGYGKEEITKGNSEWEGWGTALKPAVEPIVVARKPLSEKTVALNVLKWGTGGINIDESRISSGVEHMRGNVGAKKIESDWKNKSGFGKPFRATDSPLGRFPANLILECICDEVKEGKEIGKKRDEMTINNTSRENAMQFSKEKHQFSYGNKAIIHTNPECPCYILDRQSGTLKSGSHIKGRPNGSNGAFGKELNRINDYDILANTGGASRFFYCAKASRKERNKGLEGMEMKIGGGMKGTQDQTFLTGSGNIRNNKMQNNHPTVKPIKLMEYLVRLITPPKGIVLDCFMGSGTTGIACKRLGFNYIGIEKEQEYVDIAIKRLQKECGSLF